MGTLLFLIVGAIITFAIFFFINSHTKIVSFDGVNGYARGYLDNFIWSVILGAGITAFLFYVLEGVFNFLVSIIFNEVTLLVLAFAFIMYMMFNKGSKLKGIYDDLEKDPNRFRKFVVKYKETEDGKTPTDIYYVDMNKLFTTKEDPEAVSLQMAIVSKEDKFVKSKVTNVVYRYGIMAPSEDEEGVIDGEIYSPKDDTKTSLFNFMTIFKQDGWFDDSIKDLTGSEETNTQEISFNEDSKGVYSRIYSDIKQNKDKIQMV